MRYFAVFGVLVTYWALILFLNYLFETDADEQEVGTK